MKPSYALLIIVLVLSSLVTTYYAYQYLTKPIYCLCPTVLLNEVYNTYVYYNNKLIYHEWYFEAWPTPCCDNFPGLKPPITFNGIVNETTCIQITGITPPPGIVNYTCMIARSGNAMIIIPTRIVAQEDRACSIERLLQRFLTYDKMGLGTLYGSTQTLITGIPVIKEFIGDNRVFLIGQEFITNTTKVGRYLIVYVPGIELDISIESIGVRTGMVQEMGTITVQYYYSTNINETNTIIIEITPK
ncbi:hypothetical protein VMUT_1186 [Vulcanisaeta moutnovskia 768-28]|uniref:Uncharacterized protein n=1 Tax=Vulcanisaeta moutnovskia (strain 768-28) TaxID=985053 RepID=F0QYF8_VULM7|nr:hypothetical protein [Vulcanisaeta moutnovskia]ADY01391.1 hypothetical protein VMUT_1186 [Vulcanisaeta moutnovskia 768-28]